MRLLFFIPCLLFLLPDALPAQNAFLDLYHPFNKSLIELRTDSLFIRTQDGKTGVLERANKTIKAIAEAEKYDIIFQEAVYASPRIDITDKVIKALSEAK